MIELDRDLELRVHLRRQECIREMKVALDWLRGRSYETKTKHELSWPTSMLATHLEENRLINAERCAPWFDGSAFPKSLNAGDDCPKCGGELHAVKHRYQTDGGAPDCDWLACLDCHYATDPE